MKIIFDNEEEKKAFMAGTIEKDLCPDDLGVERKLCGSYSRCEECWEKTVGMEVENK